MLLTVLVGEEFATPFVVTVYSKGCWSVTTGGLFQRFNVQGCGTQSWLMVDFYAHVNSRALTGTNDVTVIVTNGAGPGGACIGGSRCNILTFFYQPPSPSTCQGCVITPAGLPNPAGDWVGGGLSMLPLFTIVLLAYLARSLRKGPRIYRGYLRNERDIVDWRNFRERRMTLTTFALGFLVFRSYQFLATAVYLFVAPVPTLSFPFEEILSVAVAVWFMRYLRWKFPFKITSSNSVTAAPRPVQNRSSTLPIILGAVALVALVASIVIVPAIYSSLQAFFAPQPNLQIATSPSTFTALPGSVASTSIILKGLRGPTTQVSLTVDQSPPCNGACTVPILQVTLSQNSFSISPGQTVVSNFLVNPVTFADPGSYDFIVKATPDSGLAVVTKVTVQLAGFNLTANPAVLNFTRTSSIQSTITINTFYGYSGNVSLWAFPDAKGPLASISPKTLTVPAGGSATTTLNVTSQAQGSYKVWVNGKSGKLFQTIQLPTTTSATSSSADFSLTAILGNTNLRPGQEENVTIEVSSLNGCICIVRLSVSPNISSRGPDPVLVTVSPSLSTNSTLTLIPGEFATPGPVTVTVTGTSGPITHSITITLEVI